jgi:hypothetical protein
MENYEVTLLYDAEPCPVPAHRTGVACQITYYNVPGELANVLDRWMRRPRWIRRWVAWKVIERATGHATEYRFSGISAFHIQPQREAIR